MSDATVVAGVQAAMSAFTSFGATKTVIVKQQRGAYNTFTGSSPAATPYSISAILYDLKKSKDDGGSFFDAQTALFLYDDVPPMLDSDLIEIDGLDWQVSKLEIDPTFSTYEITLRR